MNMFGVLGSETWARILPANRDILTSCSPQTKDYHDSETSPETGYERNDFIKCVWLFFYDTYFEKMNCISREWLENQSKSPGTVRKPCTHLTRRGNSVGLISIDRPLASLLRIWSLLYILWYTGLLGCPICCNWGCSTTCLLMYTAIDSQ